MGHYSWPLCGRVSFLLKFKSNILKYKCTPPNIILVFILNLLLIFSLLVSQIRLRMGEYDFSSVQEPYPFVERGVTKKIVHPKYNFFTYEYDLALVRLEEPVVFQPNIAPICLPAADETLVGENGTVTGWGRLSEGGTLPSILQQVGTLQLQKYTFYCSSFCCFFFFFFFFITISFNNALKLYFICRSQFLL